MTREVFKEILIYFSFVKQIDMLQPHMPFVVNYEKSQQVLAACSKNKEFFAFLRVCLSFSLLYPLRLFSPLLVPLPHLAALSSSRFINLA